MRVRHLTVCNFRGIRELDWAINSDMICLIGPCNSCKSTILDAIEFALSPRWNLVFTDHDFYQDNTAQPIIVQVTLEQLPKKLLSEATFGLYARGWRKKDQSIVDEPTDDCEIVLTVQLRVDGSLEPEWQVVADRHTEGKPISARDRELLGVSSLSGYVDRDLTWARGSVLTRVSSGQETIGSMLAEASRSIRRSVSSAELSVLTNSAKRIGEEARQAGVAIGDDLHPDLDLRSVGLTSSVLCLFDGKVPLRQSGLGVRRLATLVMQRQLTEEGAILLVDELEHGLEPFRVRQVIRYLRPGKDNLHQVFCCTHSPIAVVEHNASEVHVVREAQGAVAVRQADSTLQGAIRALGEHLFNSRIVLCEGATEWGFARALERHWVHAGREPLAFVNAGFAYAPGAGGTSVPCYARDIAALGYATALWCDSDAPLDPSPEALGALGVRVVQWADSLALEQRVCMDVPVDCLDRIVRLAYETASHGEQSVRDAILGRIHRENTPFASVSDLACDSIPESAVRRAVGEAAKKGDWFKSREAGELLGTIVVQYLDQMPTTDMAVKIAELEHWLYG